MLTNSGKGWERSERERGGVKYRGALQEWARRERTAGREPGIVRIWLDAMGQRLSHAFMNAYFKQSPSWANLYCSPEWGCWLKANYTLQIWPLVKTLLIWHSLDSGLGTCLWARAPESHAHVCVCVCVCVYKSQGNKTSACMMNAVRFVFIAGGGCKQARLQVQYRSTILNINIYLHNIRQLFIYSCFADEYTKQLQH